MLGRGVEVVYPLPAGGVHALRGVDIELSAGETVVLSGASGSGKSTLLNVIAGLDQISAGQLSVAGQPISELSERQRAALRLNSIGLVFQDDNLVAQFTAAENVEIILACQGAPDARDAAKTLLAQLGIEDLADRRPADMSGGQRARVGIARALAGHRQILLCDEPTGALDTTNSLLLFELLKDLSRTAGIGVLIATHDHHALDYADRWLIITDGQIEAPA